MKRLAWGLAALLLSSGCSTNEYMPANGNGYGYSERQLSHSGYEVTFVGDDTLKPQQVEDFALLHAAELGASHGFAYLSVVSSRGGEALLDGGHLVEQAALGPRNTDQSRSVYSHPLEKVQACTLVVIYSAAPRPGLGEPPQQISPLVTKLRAQYGLPAAAH